MCGIIGELCVVPGRTEANWEALVGLMVRRGPDAGGIWTDGERCTLGFRRLAILDLTPAGHQPMTSRDERFALVYNGEIYNFRELKKELEQQGVGFRSTGDSEVVLQALITWGVRALRRFNGMFALAFYDRQERSLVLARDHAGIKPLYYMSLPEGICFASQYDQLLAHPWSRTLPMSTEGRSLYLHLGYIPAPYGILANTHMLEPGTWLEVTAEGRVTKGRHFEFPAFREPDLAGEEAMEAVDEAVTRAVRRHLESDVPVGTFLSGGIDSPLVTAKVRHLTSGSFKSFTIGTDEPESDESADAAMYARELAIEHIVETATAEAAIDLLQDVVEACTEPFADFSIFPTLQVSRLASRHVKVVLSGDGGDELFWGYAGRFGSVLRKAHDFGQPYWLRSGRWLMKKYLNVGDGYPNLRFPSIGDWYFAKHTRMPKPLLGQIFPTLEPVPQLPYFLYQGSDLGETAQWLRYNEFVAHLSMVLLKVDRGSMHHSVEVRVPLLDREVVDTATRIDFRTCLDLTGQTGKQPLRRSLQKAVRYQTWDKRGFGVPMATWLRGRLRPLFEEQVLGRHEILGLPFDRKALASVYGQHLLGKADYSWGLWVLLSAVLWEDRHLIGRGRRLSRTALLPKE